jgi:hypothetical protein
MGKCLQMRHLSFCSAVQRHAPENSERTASLIVVIELITALIVLISTRRKH